MLFLDNLQLAEKSWLKQKILNMVYSRLSRLLKCLIKTNASITSTRKRYIYKREEGGAQGGGTRG